MIKQSQINHFINLIRNHNRAKPQRKGSFLNRLKSQDKTSNGKFSLVDKSARHFSSTYHQLNQIKSYQKTPQFSKILEHGKRVKTQVTDLSFNVHQEARPKNFYDKYKQQLEKKNLLRRALTKKPSNFFAQSTSEANQFFNSRLREHTQFNDQRINRQSSNGKNHWSVGCGVTVYDQKKKSSLLIKKKVNELALYDERRKQEKTRTQIQAQRLSFNSQKDFEAIQNGCYHQDNFIVKSNNKLFKIKHEQKQDYSLRRQKGKKQGIVESNIKQMKHMMAKFNKDKTIRRGLQEDGFFNDQKMKLQGWGQHIHTDDVENTPFSGRILQINR